MIMVYSTELIFFEKFTLNLIANSLLGIITTYKLKQIMEQWANYFLATAGAAASLTGLIFVSVSLNLKKILSHPHLPGRALDSLIIMSNILIVSSFCLIPKQGITLLGCEILGFDILIWIIIIRMDVTMYNKVEKPFRSHYFQNLLFSQLAIIPYLAAGIFLVMNSTIGLYLLIPGITFSLIKALTDSWVLLVEINR